MRNTLTFTVFFFSVLIYLLHELNTLFAFLLVMYSYNYFKSDLIFGYLGSITGSQELNFWPAKLVSPCLPNKQLAFISQRIRCTARSKRILKLSFPYVYSVNTHHSSLVTGTKVYELKKKENIHAKEKNNRKNQFDHIHMLLTPVGHVNEKLFLICKNLLLFFLQLQNQRYILL